VDSPVKNAARLTKVGKGRGVYETDLWVRPPALFCREFTSKNRTNKFCTLMAAHPADERWFELRIETLRSIKLLK
jgi:hypothetical protein